MTHPDRPTTWTALLCLTAMAAVGGCESALDQNRPTPARPAPATGPTTVATADLGQDPAVPGVTPPPKPFVDRRRFEPDGRPTPLLLTHAAPDAPVPLSEYGRQPVHDVDEFAFSPTLTGSDVRRRFGQPAGVAGIGDPYLVYRLSFGRELWLHFAAGYDGPLTAADVVAIREDGYSRDRVYPTRD